MLGHPYNKVWIRLPTNQGLKPFVRLAELPGTSQVWIRLPTNQGLKHYRQQYLTCLFVLSESDFQQIKDWNFIFPSPLHNARNSLNPTSNKSRIETVWLCLRIFSRHRSESDFQQIKDWNSSWYAPCNGLNYVWIRLPTNQGLKLRSARKNYNAWIVWIRLPTNQGLKLQQFRPG